MFHLTIFGGTEGEIPPYGFTAVTLFGGTELRRPTLATQLMYMRARREHKPAWWARALGSDQNLILTLFGGTILLAPTLVEEHAALEGVIRSGTITTEECIQLLDQLAAGNGDNWVCRTLTLFGACVTRYPSAAKERKSLEAAAKSGTLPDSARRALDDVIGSPAQARIRALSQLTAAPA